MADGLTIIAGVAALLSIAGVGYLCAAVLAVIRFDRAAVDVPSTRPPLTVLKPLCGDEPDLYENLCSLLRQDYPCFQVVFGVRCDDDPAVGVVRRLIAEFPAIEINLVIDARQSGINLKVANLLNMLGHARHDRFVFADSDIFAPPGYLDAMTAALDRPGVGLVTCLYTGRPTSTGWAQLGGLFINHGFLPSVLVGRMLGRSDGCFGATIATTRQILESIGGMERFKDHLADDYALGAAVREAGLVLALSSCRVRTTVTESAAAPLLAHELRWMRTIRSIESAGHAASTITYPVAMALLTLGLSLAAGHPGLGLAVLGVAVLARAMTGRMIDAQLGEPPTPVWLMLCRDVVSFGLVVASFCGTTIWWRNSLYRIQSDGRLVPVES